MVFAIVPPLQPLVSAFVHVPEPLLVTVSELLAPVLFSTMPAFAPLPEMCSNVTPLAPVSVLLSLKLLPEPVSIVLPLPVTFSVPLVAASRPLPLVVSMSSPPPERVSVWPSLLLNRTASVILTYRSHLTHACCRCPSGSM